MITEMTGDLPSSDDAFSAANDDLCATHLFEARDAPRLSLSECLRTILGKDWSSTNEQLFGMLLTVSLFSIINGESFCHFENRTSLTIQAFNTIIFTAHANFLGSHNLEHIGIALTRWERIWDCHLKSTDLHKFKKIGFIKNAFEFYHLTNIFLDADESGNRHGHVQNVDTDTMGEVNDLLERFEGVHI